ncbi:MAG: hypothetical protein CMD20_02095 [Flavobacteriales bacterium]|nr:hypothetical protein [Flavobacteriales bacterium]|tara:strand:- start:473 stop:994 length:522 start_codon:yes stop_codon:yes gene_type:complete
MKSYVYRVSPILEGVEDEIYRDILIQEDKTLEDFHFAILDAYGLQEGEMASFYTCTENWEEGLEITLMDMGTMEHESVSILMQEFTIKDSVGKDVKYYKFTYDFLFPKKFKVERIGENTEIKEDVPVLLAEVGKYEPVVNHLSDITFNDLEEESISDDDDDEPTFENIDDLDI